MNSPLQLQGCHMACLFSFSEPNDEQKRKINKKTPKRKHKKKLDIGKPDQETDNLPLSQVRSCI